MHTLKTPALLALVAFACAAPRAQAQDVTVLSRESIQSGNFAVGFATFGDSGADLQVLTTPDATFGNVVTDAGGVDGFFGDVPVAGSGSFYSAQSYTVSDPQVLFEGAATTSLSTPYEYVTAGASALSQFELLLDLAVPMAFEMRVDVIELPGTTVNGLTARADALVKISGPGETWLFNDPGVYLQSGVFDAGQWRINAYSDTRGNASAAFLGTLALAPVPEPAPALMLALGLAGLVARRKWALARAT